MDAAQLRAVQEPLKDRYREDPDAAVVTLAASGELGEGVSCSVRTGSALASAGLHPATGGDGSQLCSGDMLLEALVACAGVTVRAVSTSLDIPVQSGTVSAEGDLDFRGTLALSKEAPVGFRAIRLKFELVSEASAQIWTHWSASRSATAWYCRRSALTRDDNLVQPRVRLGRRRPPRSVAGLAFASRHPTLKRARPEPPKTVPSGA